MIRQSSTEVLRIYSVLWISFTSSALFAIPLDCLQLKSPSVEQTQCVHNSTACVDNSIARRAGSSGTKNNTHLLYTPFLHPCCHTVFLPICKRKGTLNLSLLTAASAVGTFPGESRFTSFSYHYPWSTSSQHHWEQRNCTKQVGRKLVNTSKFPETDQQCPPTPNVTIQICPRGKGLATITTILNSEVFSIESNLLPKKVFQEEAV